MILRRDRSAVAPIVSVVSIGLSVLAAAPALAGGFAIFEQSARAMGLAGAMTADTTDPSGLFYNVASGAFFEDEAYSVGSVGRATWDFTFDSQPASGVATQFQQNDPAVLAHGYYVQPLQTYLKLGFAVYQPFAHEADWDNPGSFPGRDVSTSSAIDAIDFNPSVAIRFESGLGLGLGAVYRTADLTQQRRLQTTDQLTGGVVDFADFAIDSGQEAGFGWNVGVLYQASEKFSWGFAYRSPIEIDFGGSGLLTQIATGNADLDDLLALTNPFDQDLAAASTIEFPDVASFGVSVGSAQRLRLAADVQWTGWSSFDQVAISIPDFPLYSQTIQQSFDDALSFRLGAELAIAGGNVQLRAGYAFDETPQPDSTVGAFLYDAERNSLSIGFGRDWLDVAVQWSTYSDRAGGTIDGTFGGESFLASITIRSKPELPELPEVP